tara:strand:+ start:12654 stop:12959 length:306 start_codon:yes stop_codon:yes gene_type:complete
MCECQECQVDETQQTPIETAGETNVMDRVLGTFDGIVDNATGFFGSAAGNARVAGAGLVEKGSELTGSIGEKATGAAGDIGTVIGENFDAAVTFAKGLFGG